MRNKLIKRYVHLAKVDAENRIKDFAPTKTVVHLKKYPYCLPLSRIERYIWRKFVGPGIAACYAEVSPTKCFVVTYFNSNMLRKKKEHYKNKIHDYGAMKCVLKPDFSGQLRLFCHHVIMEKYEWKILSRTLRCVSKSFLKELYGFSESLLIISAFCVDPHVAHGP